MGYESNKDHQFKAEAPGQLSWTPLKGWMLAMKKFKLRFFLYNFLIITLDTGNSVVLQSSV